MATLEVRCTVSNCHYWDEGNRCGADRILITLDKIGRQFERTDSTRIENIIEEVGQTPADQSVETCCQTFRPSGRRTDEDNTLQL